MARLIISHNFYPLFEHHSLTFLVNDWFYCSSKPEVHRSVFSSLMSTAWFSSHTFSLLILGETYCFESSAYAPSTCHLLFWLSLPYYRFDHKKTSPRISTALLYQFQQMQVKICCLYQISGFADKITSIIHQTFVTSHSHEMLVNL
jgi:hypothetical protein